MSCRACVVGAVSAVVAFGVVGSGAATAAPATMKAVRLHEHGSGPGALRYEEAPRPTPGAGQLLIEVHAASVIAGDWKIRDGLFGDLTDRMPMTLGFDASGVVAAVGAGVEGFAVGDEVFGYLTGGGAFAEYAVGPAEDFARKPATLSHEQVVGAPVSAVCAWYALVKTADLQPGQTVLIQAGAGGVGHYAVQLAHDIGATVYTTASHRNHALLRELGADFVIDYNTERFEDVVDVVDVVFDMIGGEVLERCYGVVKPGGYLVTLTERPSPERLASRGIRGSWIATPADAGVLAQIGAMMEEGRMRTHVSAVYPLSETIEAIELVAKRHATGKVVIKVR